MTKRPAKPLFPNPFYVLLLAASTVFVFTVLSYLVGPLIREQAGRDAPGWAGMRAQSSGPAAWLDRNGPIALGVEFVVMLVAGFLAMATDRWFAPKPARTETKD